MIFVAVVPQSQCHSVSRPKNGGETHVFFMQVLLTGATDLGVEVESRSRSWGWGRGVEPPTQLLLVSRHGVMILYQYVNGKGIPYANNIKEVVKGDNYVDHLLGVWKECFRQG